MAADEKQRGSGMSDDKRDHGKPPAAAPAKPGAGTAPPSLSPNAAKSEMTRRGLDRDDDNKPGAMPTPNERALLRLNRGLVLLAAAVGLFVIVGAVLLLWQQMLIRNQLDQMYAESQKTDQALATAGRIADSTRKSADSLFDLERAYLLLDASASVLPKTVAAGTPVRLSFKNYGKTPATLHAVSGRYAYSPGPPSRLAAPQTGMAVPLVVADGGTAGPYDIALDITDADLARATRGDGTVVAQAVVVYADMTGETHQTDICVTYQFKTGGFETCPAVGLDSHN